MEFIFSKKRTEEDVSTDTSNVTVICNSHKIDDLVACFEGFLVACGYENINLDYTIKKK